MKPTPTDLAILRAYGVGGAMTVPDFHKAFPALGEVKAPIERLWSNHFLDKQLVGVNGKPIYSIAAKGRRAINHGEREMGEMPAPRVVDLMRQPAYTGEKRISVRPGSQDAFECDSLILGKRVPYFGRVVTA